MTPKHRRRVESRARALRFARGPQEDRAVRARPLLLSMMLLSLPVLSVAGPYYVKGNFYCHDGESNTEPGGTCWGWDAGNEMFDDGLHGDGDANDGVFGAWVTC